MADSKPKRSRRKDARPAEIVEAALDVFAEHGFAAAKLTDVAKRAGVAKGTLYLYFETKEDLFRAAARHALAAHLALVDQTSDAAAGSIAEVVPRLLQHAAGSLGQGRIPKIVRMVLSESRAFPDLAAIWHDEVVARMLGRLCALVTAAQARNEVRPGDPHLHAMSIVGPMFLGMLFNDVFGAGRAHAPDLEALARQHAETVLNGLKPS